MIEQSFVVGDAMMWAQLASVLAWLGSRVRFCIEKMKEPRRGIDRQGERRCVLGLLFGSV